MEPRERGAKVDPMNCRTEVESLTQKPEVEAGDPRAKSKLEAGKPEVDPMS